MPQKTLSAPDAVDATSPRPQRPRLPDWNGSPVSLPAEAAAWQEIAPAPTAEAPTLLLGLGPDAVVAPLAAAGPDAGPFFWLEAPEMLDWRQARRLPLPDAAHARPVSEAAAGTLAQRCRVLFYQPGMRLFPHFWGPLLGRLDAARLHDDRCASSPSDVPALVLPGDAHTLLHQELCAAAAALRLPVMSWPARVEQPQQISALLRRLADLPGSRPPLFLSVNLRGLDQQGRIAHACRALGIRLAIWFVDMPWHVLSSLRLPWWRDFPLFATDASFLAPLRDAGARQADLLPLAAARHMWLPPSDTPPSLPPLFVGRASFPDHARFFAAAHPAKADLALAEHMLIQAHEAQAPLPHIHWWQHRLGARGWPGMAIRQAGAGADACSRRRRADWLAAAVRAGFVLCGDAAWSTLLPGTTVLPPVDYYGSLPALYARSEAVLNVTSLLLPHSLSQRHFDVWAAGGVLLSDPTPGLDLFPAELVRPMRLTTPDELPARLAALRRCPDERAALSAAWRRELRARHTYGHRLQTLLRTVD